MNFKKISLPETKTEKISTFTKVRIVLGFWKWVAIILFVAYAIRATALTAIKDMSQVRGIVEAVESIK